MSFTNFLQKANSAAGHTFSKILHSAIKILHWAMGENFNPAADHGNPAQGHINYRHIIVLGQLPRRKIALNSKPNTNSNPNPNQRSIILEDTPCNMLISLSNMLSNMLKLCLS